MITCNWNICSVSDTIELGVSRPPWSDPNPTDEEVSFLIDLGDNEILGARK